MPVPVQLYLVINLTCNDVYILYWYYVTTLIEKQTLKDKL